MNNSAQIAQAQAQAQQAQQQGNAAQAGYQQQATQYGQQYGQYQQQTDAARQAQQQYGQYLQGAGSGGNQYNIGLQQAYKDTGYQPGQVYAQGQQLAGLQNQLSTLQQNANAPGGGSSGGYGMSGAQISANMAQQGQGLSGLIGSVGNSYGASQQAYQNAITSANQYAGQQLTSEQATAGSLKDQVSAAASQMESARQQMQSFETLAQQQGGLTAAQTASYQSIAQAYQSNATAYQSMLGANAAAYAGAGLSNAQTIGAQQANAQGALKSQYTMTPDSRGGFNYFQAGKPITREQYGQGLSQVSGAK